MAVFVHSVIIICFMFLFVDRLGPTATLNKQLYDENSKGQLSRSGSISSPSVVNFIVEKYAEKQFSHFK